MELIRGSVKRTYFKYLSAAFGSAIIGSIYSFVDTIVVGQYHGPVGAASLAIFAPIWNILFSIGLLFGIGGAVIFSTIKGEHNDPDRQNGYFTVSLIASTVLAVFFTLLFWCFDGEILKIFGASEELLPMCLIYLKPIKFVIPAYIFSQMFAAYLRNDNDPVRATIAVLAGGGFNIFGDVFFTFGLDLGIFGAGIATAVGNVITLLIMLTHLLSKNNTLRIVSIKHLGDKLQRIVKTGFATFFIDVAMGIVTLLLNHQVINYLGTDALAVYGVIINLSTCVQCCAYSVGQAAQPIISINYGAGKYSRIKETLKWAIVSAASFAVIWTFITELFPLQIIQLFMTPTDEVLAIAPVALRLYGLSFIILPLNVFSTYYFQALVRSKQAFVVSVARGLIISGFMILVLPRFFEGEILWIAMPLTEFLTAFYVIYNMVMSLKMLNTETGETQCISI